MINFRMGWWESVPAKPEGHARSRAKGALGCQGFRSKPPRQAAHLETGRLRIINAPMGQELIAELNSFEVDFTSTGNMRVDVRSNGNHGDLVIATALAPRLAAIKNQNRKTPNCASHLQLTPITAT